VLDIQAWGSDNWRRVKRALVLRSGARLCWLAGTGRQLARLHSKGSLKTFVGIDDWGSLVRVVRNALLGQDFLSAMLTLMVMTPQMSNLYLVIPKTPLNLTDLKGESLGE
jgi:hypothetical protein